MNNYYVRFLQIVSELEPRQLRRRDVSPMAILLLNKIAVKDFEKQPLIVSQAMELRELGSPATLHRKIQELRETGMIEVTSIGTNRRTKYLLLTKAAEYYFQTNSDAMLQAVGLK